MLGRTAIFRAKLVALMDTLQRPGAGWESRRKQTRTSDIARQGASGGTLRSLRWLISR